MSTVTYAGTPVEVNEEGFFTDPTAWTKEMAIEMAKTDGIEVLTDQHWTVIEFMRREFFEKGTGPTVRQDLRCEREGSLSTVPEGPRQDGGAHRRDPQAEGMHLT